MGVPLHFWAEPTFRSIGEALGEVKAGADWVDSDNGRVKVIINGFQPLCFETNIEFYSGEEVPITLRYERLFGYCHRCHSLCHEERDCKPGGSNGVDVTETSHDPEIGPQHLSYKGAVDNGSNRAKFGDKAYQEEKRMGKRPVGEQRDGHEHRVGKERYQWQQGNHRAGGDHSQRQWLPAQGRRGWQNHQVSRSEMEEKAHDREEGQFFDVIRAEKMGNGESQAVQGKMLSGPKARKSLFQSEQDEDGEGNKVWKGEAAASWS